MNTTETAASFSPEEQAEIDEMITDLCTYADIFMHDHSGHWAQGIIKRTDFGWLLWDMDEDDREDEAIVAFNRGQEELPKGYYRLDKAVATKIVNKGIAEHGIGFVQGEADAGTIDNVIQTVLLGQVVYG